MREIKFRAWSKISCEMFTVVMLAFPFGENRVIVSGRGGSTDTENDDCILMQFTGCHDSKGNEIYEGDVLRFNGEYPMNLDSWMGRRFWEKTGYVYYDDKESRFTCTEMGNQVSTSYWIACSKEVIGNIYENPSLLKEA